MKDVAAANIILGQAGASERFVLKWHGLKLRLGIRPVTARTLIKISREVAKIEDIDPSGAMFATLMDNAKSMAHVCMAISVATETRFPRIVAKAISDLPVSEITKLWKIVVQQSDPSSFFFIMVLAKGENRMRTTAGKPGP